MNITQLREQRNAAWEAMDALDQAARSEDRDLTPEERASYDQHEATYTASGESIAHAERRDRNRASATAVERPGSPATSVRGDQGPSEPTQARNLGEHFAAQAGERIQSARAEGSRFTVTAPEFHNAASDVQVTDGNTGVLGPVLTEVDTTLVTGFRRRLTVAGLLSAGTLTGQAITYFIEGLVEGGFATVAEGATKPQLHVVNPTAVTEALKKIAGFIKESDEMIEDLPFLVSAINQRLLYQLGVFEEDQVLNGNGTGTNLRGLLQRSGIQTSGALADPKAGNADKVFDAITKVSTATGLDADGIIINPVDYQAFRLSKDGNGQYFGGGFFTGQYGVNGVLEQPPLWGLPTVVTPAIAAGTMAVGAFRTAATLYRKGGVRVEATNSADTDFTNNRVTIRAEERVALAVRRPDAIVKLTLGAA